MFQRLHNVAAIAFQNAMIAVVQQNDIAPARAVQALNDRSGGLNFPIPRLRAPHRHARIPAPPHDPMEQWAAKAVRRTHPTWRHHCVTQDGLVATIQLFLDSRRRQQRQRWMRFGVISNRVTPSYDFLRKRGKRPNVPSNQKESGFRFISREQIKQLGRRGRVRSIIKRQSHGRSIAGSPHRAAEKLRRRDGCSPCINTGSGADSASREPRWMDGHSPRSSHAPQLAASKTQLGTACMLSGVTGGFAKRAAVTDVWPGFLRR
jgi:hypothetical protein